MHVYLCMCVNVFIQACLCVLTKLFNPSQSLSFIWFWQIFVFRLKVTSLVRILYLILHALRACMPTLCECRRRASASCTYADYYVLVSTGKAAGWTQSVFEPTLHKSTISGYGSDSNYGKHVGKD